MSRDVPTTDEPCDGCGATDKPVFDFMGDNLCTECASPMDEAETNGSTMRIDAQELADAYYEARRAAGEPELDPSDIPKLEAELRHAIGNMEIKVVAELPDGKTVPVNTVTFSQDGDFLAPQDGDLRLQEGEEQVYCTDYEEWRKHDNPEWIALRKAFEHQNKEPAEELVENAIRGAKVPAAYQKAFELWCDEKNITGAEATKKARGLHWTPENALGKCSRCERDIESVGMLVDDEGKNYCLRSDCFAQDSEVSQAAYTKHSNCRGEECNGMCNDEDCQSDPYSYEMNKKDEEIRDLKKSRMNEQEMHKRSKRRMERINGALLAAGVEVTEKGNEIIVGMSLPRLANRKPAPWPGNLRSGYGPVNEDPLIGLDLKPHAKMSRDQLLDEVKRLETLSRPSAELRDMQVELTRYQEQAKAPKPVPSLWKAAAQAQEISLTRILNARTMLECHMALVELDKAKKLLEHARTAEQA